MDTGFSNQYTVKVSALRLLLLMGVGAVKYLLENTILGQR
jgi:hypothetical protein